MSKEPGQAAYEAWMRSVYKERTVDPPWHEVDVAERKGWAVAEDAVAQRERAAVVRYERARLCTHSRESVIADIEAGKHRESEDELP